MSKPKPKAYSYLRFSTPEQQKGDSFRRQANMAHEYATRHGLELDTELTFHDLGVSAFRGANAEAGRLADFREAVQEGLVPQGSYLLVEALDRLSRLVPRKAYRVLEDIVTAGVTVVTLNDGRAYTTESLDSDPTSLLVAIVLFMRANDESANKARRLKAAWEGKRMHAQTKPLTAQVPAWLRLVREEGVAGASSRIELIPERASVVQRIFADYLRGIGHHGIADSLNKEAVPCFGRANFWHRTYVKKILSSPATHGVFVPHQYVHEAGRRTRTPLSPVVGYYPAVVSQETFEDAQALGGTAHTTKQRSGQVVNILGGLARCPTCGSTMTRVNKGSTGKGGKPKLVCTKAKAGAGCSYVSVSLDAVEFALVTNAALLAADVPSGDEKLDERLSQVLDAIDATEGVIGNLLEVLEGGASGAVSGKLRDYEAALAELTAERDALLTRLAGSSGPILAKRVSAVVAALESEPLDRPRANAALRAVLEAAVVDHSAGTLLLQWKHGGQSSVMFAMPKWVGPALD
jgi:DNA invertase Pin-like site-specific DNA recombinase